MPFIIILYLLIQSKELSFHTIIKSISLILNLDRIHYPLSVRPDIGFSNTCFADLIFSPPSDRRDEYLRAVCISVLFFFKLQRWQFIKENNTLTTKKKKVRFKKKERKNAVEQEKKKENSLTTNKKSKKTRSRPRKKKFFLS